MFKKLIASLLLIPFLSGCIIITDQHRGAASSDARQKSGHPEAKPFDEMRNAKADVEAALARATTRDTKVLLVMGANWCHDSRALAGWFEQPRFVALIDAHYELVFVDVGQKDRNIDIAQRFGLEDIVGTPTVLILSADGEPLNLETAPSWRNAASRSEDEIFDYFQGFALNRP